MEASGGPVLSFRFPCGVWAAGYLAQCVLETDVFPVVSNWRSWATDSWDINAIIGDLAVQLGLGSDAIEFIATNIAIDNTWRHFVAAYQPNLFTLDFRWRAHLGAPVLQPLHWLGDIGNGSADD